MGLLRRFYYFIPPKSRLLARRLWFMPYDIFTRIFRPNLMIPPRGIIFTGGGDFIRQGKKFTGYFIRYGNLKPNSVVLDVGSGIGRMALGLTEFISPEGRYEGFDVMPEGIKWCTQNITPKYPNFRFTLVEVKNDLYLDKGIEAAKFVFPYENQSFDFVFLTSVFTHMLPDEVEQYMSEIFRVLKPGGRCLATFFILNHDSIAAMEHKKEFRFDYDYGFYRLFDPRVKHANVAYNEDYILKQLIDNKGFRLCNVLYGWWSGRKKGDEVDFQDMIVVEKPI